MNSDSNQRTSEETLAVNQAVSPQLHIHLIDKLAFLNGLVSGIALYPQLFSFLVRGGGESVSVTTYFLIFLNSVVWILYALHRSLLSLFIASALNAIAAGLILLFALI